MPASGAVCGAKIKDPETVRQTRGGGEERTSCRQPGMTAQFPDSRDASAPFEGVSEDGATRVCRTSVSRYASDCRRKRQQQQPSSSAAFHREILSPDAPPDSIRDPTLSLLFSGVLLALTIDQSPTRAAASKCITLHSVLSRVCDPSRAPDLRVKCGRTLPLVHVTKNRSAPEARHRVRVLCQRSGVELFEGFPILITHCISRLECR